MKLKSVFIFIAVLCFPLFSHAQQMGGTEESVMSFDEVVHIQKNGSAQVTETILYNFGDKSKHGIYRTIPVEFKNNLGTLKTRITDISVVDESNVPYNFTTSGRTSITIKIGDAGTLVSGIHKYIISYSIERVVTFFEDHDEFYWNVTGNEWTVPIEHASSQVFLPGNISADSIKVQCFTGDYGSVKPCSFAQAEENGARYEQGQFPVNDGLTIVTGFPKGIVIPPTTFEKLKGIAKDNWIILVPLFVLFAMFSHWRSKGRDPKINNTIIAQYEAPLGLSPAQVATLLKFRNVSHGVTAEIIELAVQGFLKINFIDKDYELVDLSRNAKPEKNFQQTLLSGLFKKGSGEVIKLSSLKEKFYKTYSTINSEVMKSLVEGKLIVKSPGRVIVPYVILAFFVGFLAFISINFFGVIGLLSLLASAIIILLFGIFMPRRTLLGAQTVNEILGLKLYMEVAEKDRINFHNAPEKTPERFEKLLPYAIALGVEKQWAKQFEGIYNREPSWYHANGSTFNTILFVNSLNNFHSVSAATLTSLPPSRSSSGGSGFSGGGSGGGFGGGGGGSW